MMETKRNITFDEVVKNEEPLIKRALVAAKFNKDPYLYHAKNGTELVNTIMDFEKALSGKEYRRLWELILWRNHDIAVRREYAQRLAKTTIEEGRLEFAALALGFLEKKHTDKTGISGEDEVYRKLADQFIGVISENPRIALRRFGLLNYGNLKKLNNLLREEKKE